MQLYAIPDFFLRRIHCLKQLHRAFFAQTAKKELTSGVRLKATTFIDMIFFVISLVISIRCRICKDYELQIGIDSSA
jgi:hypothetical protein